MINNSSKYSNKFLINSNLIQLQATIPIFSNTNPILVKQKINKNKVFNNKIKINCNPIHQVSN